MNNVKKQFNNLKKGAKRVFVGMMVLCLICTATGIGSIFAYADEYDGSGLENNTTENSIPTCEHSYGDWTDAGDVHTRTCSLCGDVQSEGHSMNWVAGEGDTEISVCSICGHQGETRSSASQPAADPESTTPDTTIPAPSVNPEDCTHNYTQWYPKDALVHTRACSICQDIQEEEHNIVDGKCTVCGYEQITDESGETTPTDHVHNYSYTYDNSKHYGVCSCGDTTEGEHQVTNWVKNGADNTLSGLCDVCGALVTIPDDGTVTSHVHVYTYTDNLDGSTHTAHCSVEGCPEPEKTEAHEIGSWTSDDHGHHTITCSLCDYSKVEDCEFGDWYWNGNEENPEHYRNCYVCGYEEREACTVDPETGICSVCNNQQPMRMMLRSSLLRTTASNPPYTYEELMASMPVTKTGLVYSGSAQDLFSSKGSLKTDTQLTAMGLSNVTKGDIKDNDDPTHPKTEQGTNAKTYNLYQEISYKHGGNDYTVKGEFTAIINPAVFEDNVTVTPSDLTKYEDATTGIPFFTLKIGSKTLVEGDDFISSYTGTIGEAGKSCTFTFKNKDTNYTLTSITRELSCDPVALTFNDSTEKKAAYYKELKIKAPTGYTISKSETSGYTTELLYNTVCTDATLDIYVKKNGKPNSFHQEVTGITITNDHPIESLVTTFPAFTATADYTGSDVTLMKVSPVLNETYITSAKLTDVKWGFTKVAGSGEATYTGESPKGKAIGEYEYQFFVKYKDGSNEKTINYTDTTYKTTILKALSNTDIKFTAQAKDYQSLSPVTCPDIKNFYDVKDGTTQLQVDTHYIVTTNENLRAPYEAGTNVVLTFTGVSQTGGSYNQYYKGTVTQTVPVADINVLFNGEAQKAKYDDAVVISASGYTISETEDGTFDSQLTFDTVITHEDVKLYFKATGTSRVVYKTIKDLTVGEGAAIKVLYDGSPDKKALYQDSVRISAEGYDVSTSSKGSFAGAYILYYDDNKQMAPVPDFVLYFKNQTTGMVYRKTISDLNLYSIPSGLHLQYNGADLQDWYKTNVAITATDDNGNKYMIADAEGKAASKYTNSYAITGSGTISKKLYFKYSNTEKECTVVVNIDKVAPTGSINIVGQTSSSFIQSDEVKIYVKSIEKGTIAASDNLSGVDYILFYTSEKYYGSGAELEAAVSTKSAAWSRYTDSDRPSTAKDKRVYVYAAIYDKAGNVTYISTHGILYDTVAPKMVSATVAQSKDSKSSVVALGATDKLSGVNRFKMEYREKTSEDMAGPDKDYLFNMGTYIEVKEEKDGTALGSTTVDDLDSTKTYMFYFVAVDRAGNISDVMSKEVKGSEAKKDTPASGGGAAAGGGSGSGSKSGGLTPAPSGIAGGGGSQSKPKGGAGKSTTPTQQTNAEKIANTKINRNPYIGDATGSTKIGEKETSGWTKILSELNKADKGTMISVEMSGFSEVPDDLLTNLKKREDVNVKLQMADDVEWSIVGADITDESFRDMDLGVKLGSKNIPAQILQDVTGTNPHVEFSVNHEGDLGFTATIGIPVGVTNKGMNATLYYYDANGKELKPQSSCIVDGQGFARFPLTHCSDYTVVISPEPMLATGTSVSTVTTETLTADEILDGTKIRLTDLFGINQSGRIWLFVIALISAGLCIAILFLPSFQQDRGLDRGDLL
ncbi:hypothetical protein [Butyrivibrio sp. AE2032]|uniref:hypothetical protein n=1 Tax=Butyrivibrio sp. AE2032 TaxID=1458463 RepID=UPI0005563B02|nr:hypothetical protein [Butyrivibrio sp. AE2032]